MPSRSTAKLVIGAFADLSTYGGFVPLAALEDYLHLSAKVSLLALIRQLEEDGLVESTHDLHHGPGLRLTAKGAVRLWFWNWPPETRISAR